MLNLLRTLVHHTAGLVLLTVCVTWGSAQSLFAQETVDSLWRYLPPGASLIVEGRRVGDLVRDFAGSETFQRIQAHSAWQKLQASQDLQHYDKVDQAVREVSQHSLGYWTDRLFGDEFVFALTPGANGQSSAVVLSRLLKPADFTEFLVVWDKLEPRTETVHEHRGFRYVIRVKEGGRDPLCFAHVDRLLILSDQPAPVIAVLEQLAEIRAGKIGLDNTELTTRLHREHETSPLRVFLLPALWNSPPVAAPEAGADGSAESGAGPDAGAKSGDFVERSVQQWLRECDLISLGFRLDSGIVAEISIHSRTLGNHPNWQKIVARTAGVPQFLERVPSTALAAFAGRPDFAELSQWVISSLSPEQLRSLKNPRQILRGMLLDQDLFVDILPELPLEMGGFIVPRSDWPVNSIPVNGLLAFGVPNPNRASPGENQPQTVRRAIQNGVDTGVTLMVSLTSANRPEPLVVEEKVEKSVTIRWIRGWSLLEPAYAMTDDYFVLATSPQTIEEFVGGSSSATWWADPQIKSLKDNLLADASQIWMVRSDLIRQFLICHREVLLKQWAASHKLQLEEVGKRLDRMLEWIQLSDQVVMTTTLLEDQIKLVLAVRVTSVAKPAPTPKP